MLEGESAMEISNPIKVGECKLEASRSNKCSNAD